jgi:hypothetical protein
VFLAKLHARTSQPEVPPIQIYYVKYLARSLVWPDRFPNHQWRDAGGKHCNFSSHEELPPTRLGSPYNDSLENHMSFPNIVVAIPQPGLEVPNSTQFTKTEYQTLPELENFSDLSGQTSNQGSKNTLQSSTADFTSGYPNSLRTGRKPPKYTQIALL